jgi:hypothetical protein
MDNMIGEPQSDYDLLSDDFEEPDAPDWGAPATKDLQYRDEVTERLIAAMEEYLSFSTMRDLIRLISDSEV